MQAHAGCNCRGFYEEGVVSFRAALALRPRNARALFHLGNAQFALQAFAEAERSFKAALQVRCPCDHMLALFQGLLRTGALNIIPGYASEF